MNELSNEELKRLSNDDLRQLFLKVRSVINYSKKSQTRSMTIEVYFCYISKELNSRNFEI